MAQNRAESDCDRLRVQLQLSYHHEGVGLGGQHQGEDESPRAIHQASANVLYIEEKQRPVLLLG